MPATDRPFRVLVTGSRTYTDRATVWAALDQVAAEHPGQLIVVHGAASGADKLAVEWVDNVHAEDEPHPVTNADYDRDGAIAPILRNQRMVDAGADLCVTFIARCPCPHRREPHGTHGSVHCASAAAAAGIPVRHAMPTGEAGQP